MAKGAVQTTAQTTFPQPTAAEIEAQDINLQLARAQLGLFEGLSSGGGAGGGLFGASFTSEEQQRAGVRQIGPMAFLTSTGDTLSPQEVMQRIGPKQLSPLEQEALKLAKADIELREAAQKRIMDFLDRATQPLTDQELADLRKIREETLAIGESDITKFAKGIRETILEEITPARGLRPTDTPTVTQLARVGEEETRQKSQLARELSAIEAGQRIELPFRIAEFASGERRAAVGSQLSGLAFRAGLNQFQEGLAAAGQQFQAALQQQAFQNRLNLLNISPVASNLQNFLANLRLAGGVTTQRTSGAGVSPLELAFAGLGGAGSVLSGLGSFRG